MTKLRRTKEKKSQRYKIDLKPVLGFLTALIYLIIKILEKLG